MRPLAELEYEKACRGDNNLPIANEFAWGNTSIFGTGSYTNTSSDSERNAVAANCNHRTAAAELAARYAPVLLRTTPRPPVPPAAARTMVPWK